MGLRSIPSALNTKMLTPLPMLVPGSTPPAGAGFDRRRWRTSAELQFQTHVRALAARIASELSLSFRPRNRRGRREGRVPTAPMVRVQQKHAAEPQVQADHPAFPAQWFYGLYVISPVTIAWLPPSPVRRESVFTTLTPALERQDHTTSPSA